MTSWNLPRLAQGAALAATITTLQHVALVDSGDIPREWRYILGVGAIIAGFAVAYPERRAVIALGAASAGASIAPLLGYHARRRLLERRPTPWRAAP